LYPISEKSAEYRNDVTLRSSPTEQQLQQHQQQQQQQQQQQFHQQQQQQQPFQQLSNELVTYCNELIAKFDQHANSFLTLEQCLGNLDEHLKEFTPIIEKLRSYFNNVETNKTESLESTASYLESRIVMINVKKEQVRMKMNDLCNTPTMNDDSVRETISTMIQHISPSPSSSQRTARTTADRKGSPSSLPYHELIAALQYSLRQKMSLIDNLNNSYDHTNRKTTAFNELAQTRQQLLLDLTQKTENLMQQTITTGNLMPTPPNFDCYNIHQPDQVNEFDELAREYHILEEQNRLLKHKVKTNIQFLYNLTQPIKF